MSTLLFVKSGPTAEGVTALSYDHALPAFTSSGDGTLGRYKGIDSGVTGTVVYEDFGKAVTESTAPAAAKVFTCVDAAGADKTVTFAGFLIHVVGVDLPSGFDGGQVPGVACRFAAASVAIA